MNPRKVSAQFAAYTWFEEVNAGKPAVQEEAVRFARENWPAFLGCAPDGLGKLLLRIAGKNRSKAFRRKQVPAAITGK